MGVDQTLNTVLERGDIPMPRFVTNLILAENGAETDDFLEVEKQTEIADQLLNNPSIKVVHLSIGGNDVLGDWNVDMITEETEAWKGRIPFAYISVIAFILDVRPDVHVLWSGYMYPNFEEVIETCSTTANLASILRDMGRHGLPEFRADQQRTEQLFRGNRSLHRYHAARQFREFPGPDYSTPTVKPSSLGVAPGGTYATTDRSLPIGFPEYPSPMNSMRDYGITRDCFHLSTRWLSRYDRPAHPQVLPQVPDERPVHPFQRQARMVPFRTQERCHRSYNWSGLAQSSSPSVLTFNTTTMESPVVEAPASSCAGTVWRTNPVNGTVSGKVKSGAFWGNANVEARDLMPNPMPRRSMSLRLHRRQRPLDQGGSSC